MLVLLAAVSALDPPHPFRFGGVGGTASFALFAGPPVVMGLLSVSRVGTVLVAALQALSPLALVPLMFDPNADLSFIGFIWWYWVPQAVAVVVFVDWLVRWHRARRRLAPAAEGL